MEMGKTFSFPIGNQFRGDFKSNILLSRGRLKSTLIQVRRLDIFFRVRSSSRDESADTAVKGTRSFIQLVRAYERVGGFINLGGFRDVGVFDKVFDLIGSMRSTSFR